MLTKSTIVILLSNSINFKVYTSVKIILHLQIPILANSLATLIYIQITLLAKSITCKFIHPDGPV